jgi:tetratricopeptide (TPR) repeat protein
MRMTMRSKLETLLDNGNAWYKNKQYTKPEGQNAAQSYQAALEIAPELIPAQEGLERIAKTLTEIAQKSLARAELSDARAAIHEALVALPSYPPALELEAELLSSSSIDDKIETLLDQADRHTRKGRLFAPSDNNAFDAYSAVLAIDKHNTLALERRGNLVNALNEVVMKLIDQGEYEPAEQHMAAALNQQPNNKDLRQLSKIVDEAIVKHKYRNTPRVDTVRASGVSNIPLNAQQPRSIAISDKIYFKFDYYNLEDSKIMLSAQLFDHNNNNNLGSKPVFVKGPDGESELIFDLDRNGIKAGTYRLELSLAGKKIAELIFRVG